MGFNFNVQSAGGQELLSWIYQHSRSLISVVSQMSNGYLLLHLQRLKLIVIGDLELNFHYLFWFVVEIESAIDYFWLIIVAKINHSGIVASTTKIGYKEIKLPEISLILDYDEGLKHDVLIFCMFIIYYIFFNSIINVLIIRFLNDPNEIWKKQTKETNEW